jgi:hypothetical protein
MLRFRASFWLCLAFAAVLSAFAATPAQHRRARASGGVSLDRSVLFGGHIETTPLVDRLRFRPVSTSVSATTSPSWRSTSIHLTF